jgi:hypothetical protein
MTRISNSIFSLVEDFILAEKDKLETVKPGLADERITALREIKHNWRDMTADQLAEAMTISHFSSYFSDAISRMFLQEYQLQAGAWRKYCWIDTVPDFRPVKRWRMAMPGTLYLRREKAEAKATSIDEGDAITYKVEEYARQFDISWQAVLNDDLGEIMQTPRRMLRMAQVFEDQFVSNLYDNATSQAALVALGATYAGTGRLTAANLAVGINAMMSRTDVNGNPIAIRQAILVVPPLLEQQAAVLMQSELMPGTPNNDRNVLPSFLAGYQVDPYIATASPNVPWYLFAQPNDVPAVAVARLASAPTPYVIKKASNIELVSGSVPAQVMLGSFETGDITYSVSDIIGGRNDATYVGIIDPNGIYYSSGTTA